ncbi:hypothetical protein BKA62DRAFT_724621 [Auriculariales sp. MPI-PUGE-AT-0066]|nr:hypothetical protein BKA62DRAFT_724621 [Auriculariales sp. MPI-PUGE-AT-0066]
MSAPPPVPPRPINYGSNSNDPSAPPPLPPLPANYQYAYDPVFDGPAPRHWEDPLVAPRPFRYDPGIPADMASQLERQLSIASTSGYHQPPPPPNGCGGYAPPRTLPTPMPPTASGWTAPQPIATPSPYGTPPGQPYAYPYGQQHVQVPPPPPPPIPQHPQAPGVGWGSPPLPVAAERRTYVLPPLGAPLDYVQSLHGHQRNSSLGTPSFPSPGGSSLSVPSPGAGLRSSTPALPQANQFAAAPVPAPSSFAPTGTNQANMPTLELPRPTLESLTEKMPPESADPGTKVQWAKEVLALVERTHAASAAKGSMIVDPALNKLVEKAIKDILDAAAVNPPVANGLALYLRGQLAGSGSFPTFIPKNPKNAFADMDAAARAGYGAAWFSIARDYETVGDMERARQHLEKGMKLNVEGCYYRMGMAHLLGQLGLRQEPNRGLPMLHRAAQLASAEVPQPAHVFAMLLLGTFPSYRATPEQLAPFLPPGSTAVVEAKRYLERAAYLGNGAAQFKLGHAYEFGEAPFAPDPLLSVQYYSLAAQRGHPEADMALSKWFLCGSEGAFEKDEGLARTFAEKSALRGETEGEFAMGYYCEASHHSLCALQVGIGAPNKTKDLEGARKWYTLAAEKGSAEAKKRLDVLAAAQPVLLGREEHEQLKNATLVRKRTQARDDAWAAGRRAKQEGRQGLVPIAEDVRKAHMATAPPPLPEPGFAPVAPAATITSAPQPAAVASTSPLQPKRRPGAGGSPTMMNIQPATELGPATTSGSRPSPHTQPLHGGRVRIPIRLDDPGVVPPAANDYSDDDGEHVLSTTQIHLPSAASRIGGGRVTAGAFGSTRPGTGTPLREEIVKPAPGPSIAPIPVPGASNAPPVIVPTTPPKKNAAAAAAPPKKGPQSFAEMGYHPQKMDEKECLIM